VTPHDWTAYAWTARQRHACPDRMCGATDCDTCYPDRIRDDDTDPDPPTQDDD
jgi:hypothetical protein